PYRRRPIMKMTQETEILKGENLDGVYTDLKAAVQAAARDGKPVHEVELTVWKMVLQLGRESLAQFFALQGTGWANRWNCLMVRCVSGSKSCTPDATCRLGKVSKLLPRAEDQATLSASPSRRRDWIRGGGIAEDRLRPISWQVDFDTIESS